MNRAPGLQRVEYSPKGGGLNPVAGRLSPARTGSFCYAAKRGFGNRVQPRSFEQD